MQVDSDRTWRFAAPPEQVWAALVDTSAYRSWWPWLHRLDAGPLAEGEQWRCTVKTPLPYTLRFTLAVGSVTDGERIDATIDGDVRGTAQLTLAADGTGSELRLRSGLSPVRRPIALLAGIAAPVARWGHDWVLDTGVRQFARRALGTTVAESAAR